MIDKQIRKLGVVLIACFVLLFLQLNNLQIVQAHKLANAPGNPRVVINEYQNPRGAILSANGTVLAESVPAKNASQSIFKYQRVYPQGSLFSQIVGYDSIIYGADGVEASYDQYLTAHTSAIRTLKDLFSSRTEVDNVTLTMSVRLQNIAAQALGSLKGAVVAIVPATGAILAMYSSPSFDPNPLVSLSGTAEHNAWQSYQNNPSQPMLDRAFRRSYAPGSTFKVVTASAVYDHAPALAKKAIPVLTALALPGTTHLLHNYGGESCGGKIFVLFQVSCDTGFGQIGLDLGPQNLYSQATAYGFNKRPPLDLPYVVKSTFPPPASFTRDPSAVAFSAIGQQNVSATALQMALATAGVANKGIVMIPHVMEQVRNSQGRLVKTWKPRPWLTATSQATAAAVVKLMIGVVQGGTAMNVALPGVQVAAKTGTAQGVPGQCCTNWLVAFAPASHPIVAVAVVVPYQPGLPLNPTGSAVAGPIARTMLAAALRRG